MFQFALDSALFTFKASAPTCRPLLQLPPTSARNRPRAYTISPIKIQEPPFTIPDKNLHILILKALRGSIPRSPYAATPLKAVRKKGPSRRSSPHKTAHGSQSRRAHRHADQRCSSRRPAHNSSPQTTGRPGTVLSRSRMRSWG